MGLLVFTAGGVLVYVHGFNPELRNFIFELVRSRPFVGQCFGGLLILAGLGALQMLSRSGRKVRYVNFATEGGEVSISMNAVRDFIRRIGAEFPAVLSIEPEIHMHFKNRVDIDLKVNVKAGYRVPELSGMLRTRVEEGLQDELGITGIRKIQVRISKIVGTPERD
jgi:hypothetical protein